MRRWVALLLVCGCEQVTRLPTGPVQVLPDPVWDVFVGSCSVAASCHGPDQTQELKFDREGSFVGTAVIPGNLEGSSVYVQIDEGRMPQSPGVLTEGGRFVLFGWISDGAPLVEPVGETDTDTGAGTSAAGTMDLGGTTGPVVPDYDEFAVVLDVIRGNCGGPLCHRGGANSPPVLEDAVAYENLVDGASVADMLPYVVPGDPDNSWVIVRLTAARGTTIMPADGALTEQQIDLFREWIAAGAQR